MKKRIISALLAVCMLASLLSVSAFAQTEQSALQEQSGKQASAETAVRNRSVASSETGDSDGTDPNTNKELVQEEQNVSNFLAPAGTPPAGSGTEEAPYQISTADELYWFAELVNSEEEGANASHAKLMNDISVSENLTADGQLNENPTRDWEPIGSEYTPYVGTFDGQGHTINGLYCDDLDNISKYVGLFGFVGENGVVQNVTVANSSFKGEEEVGGICGENYGTITGCTNNGEVAGIDYNKHAYAIGGVCGVNHGAIENCTNNGQITVTGDDGDYIGGVCGDNYAEDSDATMTNCTNNGNVTVEGDNFYNIGGVSGDNDSDDGDATMTSCTNNGKIIVTGGACGNIGGVNGWNDGLMEDCTNSGAVTVEGAESAWIGGVVGLNYTEPGSTATIDKCTNIGAVSATGEGSSIGGVCGLSNSTIDSCASGGAVSATDAGSSNIGGVCGSMEGGTVNNCYFNNTAVSGDVVGGSEGDAAVSNSGGLPATAFASGEAAWRLNTQNGPEDNSGIWAQGNNIPKLAKADKSDAIYSARFWATDNTDESTVVADFYLNPGDPITPPEGYVWRQLMPEFGAALPARMSKRDVVCWSVATIDLANTPTPDVEGYGVEQTLAVKVNMADQAGATVTYQWRRNGENIPGATASTYTIAKGLAAGDYEFTCVVSITDDESTCIGITSPVTFTVKPDDKPDDKPADEDTDEGDDETPDAFTVNAWVTTGGTISPSGLASYRPGESATYTITPAAGYRIVKVTVDGVNVGVVTGYTFSAINRNHEIGVYFDKTSTTVGISPVTGDPTTVALWIVLLALAVVGLGAVVVLRRKKN